MQKRIYTFLFLLSLMLLGPSATSHASVITFQSDSSSIKSIQYQYGMSSGQTLGPIATTTITALQIYASASFTGTRYIDGVTISVCKHLNCTGDTGGNIRTFYSCYTPGVFTNGNCRDYDNGLTTGGGSRKSLTANKTLYTFDFTHALDVYGFTQGVDNFNTDTGIAVPGGWYVSFSLPYQNNGVSYTGYFYGSSGDSYAGGSASFSSGGTPTGTVSDLYFQFADSGGFTYNPVITTQTVDPASGTFHVVGTWTASTTACASQYLDVWQNTGLESHRELSLHGVFPITSAPIYATTSGAFDFTFDIIDSSVSVGATSTTYSLNPNQQFYAQLYQSTCGYDPFTGTGVAPALLTSTTTITVATSSTIIEGGINNNPFTGANYGNNSLPTSTDMLSFVNVPNLLATKVPFAYIFQVSTVIYNAVNGSTSAAAIPSGSFKVKFPVKFGITGVATATTTITIDMFSTSTIGYFLTPSYVGLLRGLMVAVTYFLTAWYLFHEARNRKLL